MLIDSHCHLEFPDFKGDFKEVIDRAASSDVGLMLTISTSISDFQSVIRVASYAPNLYASVGIHPDNTLTEPQLSGAQIASLCAHEKVIGIGETGLDYHYENHDKQLQEKMFKAHIEAAQKTGLPVIVHTRDAEKDTVRILKEMLDKAPFKAVIHCFTGSRWLAEECLKLGFYISFSGIVTFKNAKSLQEVAEFVPVERILVETDAPYLAPVPFRGKRNEPSFVSHTAQFVADLKGITFKSFCDTVEDNFFKTFDKASAR
jgi:TatD DNase family protein